MLTSECAELCSTGFSLSEIQEIKEFCVRNNFRYSPVLTSNSSLLISNDPSSAKSKAAAENGIKIVDRQYLVSQSITKARWSDLTGRKVTITGFEQNPAEIIDRIAALNGIYTSSLQKDTSYLIAISPSHISKKMEMAVKWNVKIRDLKWIMSEEPFKLLDTIPDQVPAQSTNLAKLPLMLESSSTEFMDGVYIYLGKGFTPELRLELGKLVRIYGGVVLDTLSEIVTHHVVGPNEFGEDVVGYKWLKDSVREKRILERDDYVIKERRLPPVEKMIPRQDTLTFKPKDSSAKDTFSGLSFNISGFSASETKVIKQIITSHGGTFSNPCDYHIRPFQFLFNQNAVTEFWVEACIRAGKVIEPKSVLCKPTVKTISKDFIQVVTTTGLDEYERDWVERVVEIVGGKTTREMSRKNTILVSKTPKGLKMEKAKEWGIRVMSMDEVEDLVRPKLDLEKLSAGYKKSCAISEDRIVPVSNLPIEIKNERKANTDRELLSMNTRRDSTSPSPPPLTKRIRIDNDMEVRSEISTGVGYKDHLGEKVQMQLFENLLPREKKFLFSGLPLDLRDELSEIIRSLGGIVLESDSWSDECTHLIITKITKTEKFLAACASCCWILKADFIKDSALNRKWAAETDYIPTNNEYADAAQYWKLNYSISNRKPFHDWNIFLDLDTNRQEGFKRLLIAGGAKILDSIDNIDRDIDFYYVCDGEVDISMANVTHVHSAKIIEWMLSSGKVPLD